MSSFLQETDLSRLHGPPLLATQLAQRTIVCMCRCIYRNVG